MSRRPNNHATISSPCCGARVRVSSNIIAIQHAAIAPHVCIYLLHTTKVLQRILGQHHIAPLPLLGDLVVNIQLSSFLGLVGKRLRNALGPLAQFHLLQCRHFDCATVMPRHQYHHYALVLCSNTLESTDRPSAFIVHVDRKWINNQALLKKRRLAIAFHSNPRPNLQQSLGLDATPAPAPALNGGVCITRLSLPM
jgi:hypothetical protein